MQRHELDPVSLTFGLIFLGVANGWLMVATGAADVAGLRWFFPVLLLGAGAAGTLSSVLRGRRTGQETGQETGQDDTRQPAPAVDTPPG